MSKIVGLLSGLLDNDNNERSLTELFDLSLFPNFLDII